MSFHRVLAELTEPIENIRSNEFPHYRILSDRDTYIPKTAGRRQPLSKQSLTANVNHANPTSELPVLTLTLPRVKTHNVPYSSENVDPAFPSRLLDL